MISFIHHYWAQAISVIGAVYAVALFALRKSFASVEAVAQLDEKLTHIETKIINLPTQDEIHALNIEIANLCGDLKGVRATLRATTHQLELLIEKAVNRSE